MITVKDLDLLPDVKTHCQRVAAYSYMFTLALGYSEKAAWNMYTAGREHDLGKMLVDQNILNSDRKLTDIEIQEIAKHTSDEYLDQCMFSSPLSKAVARYHHMDYSDIPKAAQIVAICDVFDALTTPRSYNREINGKIVSNTHDGLDIKSALDIMMSDPRQNNLNRELLTIFSRAICSDYEYESTY